MKIEVGCGTNPTRKGFLTNVKSIEPVTNRHLHVIGYKP